MQALYTLGLRQINNLNSEITRYGSAEEDLILDKASLNGQIVVSLSALSRTIDDYEDMAKKELVQEKQERAMQRVERFQKEYATLKQAFNTAKQQQQAQQQAADRATLLQPEGSTPTRRTNRPINSMPPAESPFTFQSSSNSSNRYTNHSGASPFSTAARGPASGNSSNNPRTNAALDEHSFLNNTNSALDGYIAHGQAILGNLHGQRDMMKGTQKRLLSVANTLGLSRETISFIERRGKGDSFVLFGGIAFTLLCFILIIYYFG